MKGITAYIALGSNLGDRRENLRTALKELDSLPTIDIGRVSSVYETAPVGMTEQPKFLNMAAEISTSLSAHELLEAMLQVENQMGRERTVRWGPRVIDLDLLVYGSSQIDMPGLIVPHPRLQERAFVLRPLMEIAPNLILPGDGESVESLWEKLDKNGNN